MEGESSTGASNQNIKLNIAHEGNTNREAHDEVSEQPLAGSSNIIQQAESSHRQAIRPHPESQTGGSRSFERNVHPRIAENQQDFVSACVPCATSVPSQRNWITGSSSGSDDVSREEENLPLIQRNTTEQSMLVSDSSAPRNPVQTVNQSVSRSVVALVDVLAAAWAGNEAAIQALLTSGLLMTRAERHESSGPPIPADERRYIVVSEVVRVLRLLSSDNIVQNESSMMVNAMTRDDVQTQNGFIEEESDEDDDLPELSYEELLLLREQIGDVNNGLSEEAIVNGMSRHIHQSVTLGSSADKELCCICQDEYMDGQELGKLDCKHNFHFECTKLWLMRKNSCPICKRIALAA